ncbi:MAG TPA: hypothetical protein VF069_08960 [Streptosporangiaceae bacterium]
MTRRTALLVAVAGLVTSAGCGQGARPAGSVDSPTPAQRCQSVATITEADSGRGYCLARSARVEVYLHGTARDRWPPITLEGDALRRTASGKGTLVVGVTGGFFVADHAGTARLTAARRPCDQQAPVRDCKAPRTFEVSVVVR